MLLDVNGLEGFNAFFGVVAAVAAVGALFFAWKSFRAAVNVDRRTVQPRCSIYFPNGPDCVDAQGKLTFQVNNAGGDAKLFMAVVHAGDDLFVDITRTVLGHSSTDHVVPSYASAGKHSAVPIEVLVIAKDVDGTWWDAKAEKPIRGDLRSWIDETCRNYGLTAGVALPEVDC